MNWYWHSVQLVGFVAALSARAQGAFVYDQESANEGTGGGLPVPIQANQPIGQSFAPTLSAVGFIRLFLSDTSINGLGATVRVNLLADSITGNVIGSTEPVSMPDGFSSFPNFFFPTPVPVNPGTTYFFQPIVESGDNWMVIAYNGYNYSGGTAFVQGALSPANDLWFREGIVVPEPGTWALMLLGLGALVWRKGLFA